MAMEMDLRQESELKLPLLPKEIISALQKSADKAGIARFAVVGGAVRDSLINRQKAKTTQNIPDLDFVIEGSAIALARILFNELEPNKLTDYREHKSFGTVELKVDGVPIDLATAREEKYEKAGFNPRISSTKLEKDLERRDFTINAIAFEPIKLKLIDPHNGLRAIKTKQLIFIHSQSVEDDPTRILRGARYAARLDFNLDTESLSQIKSTLSQWPWDWEKGDPPESAPPALGSRLRMELDIMFTKEPWESVLTFLQSWGALVLLEDGLQSDNRWRRRLHWALRFNLPLLTCLITAADDPITLAKRLQLPIRQQELIKEFCNLRSFLSTIRPVKSHKSSSPTAWCKILESHKWRAEAIGIAICFGVPHWSYLLKWYLRWRHIKAPINAHNLMKMGWQSGPSLGEELNKLRYEEIERLEAKKKSRDKAQ